MAYHLIPFIAGAAVGALAAHWARDRVEIRLKRPAKITGEAAETPAEEPGGETVEAAPEDKGGKAE